MNRCRSANCCLTQQIQRDIIERVTNRELAEKAGRILGRRGWKLRLSVALKRDYVTVLRWADGQLPVPDYVDAALELLEACEEIPPRWRK